MNHNDTLEHALLVYIPMRCKQKMSPLETTRIEAKCMFSYEYFKNDSSADYELGIVLQIRNEAGAVTAPILAFISIVSNCIY